MHVFEFLLEAKEISIDSSAIMIEQYIFDQKGVKVRLPRGLQNEKDIELFEKAINIVCNYYARYFEMRRSRVPHQG